jgi:hypothetical protein
MFARFASKFLLLVIASGLVFFGTGAAAFAVWAALTPPLGEAWAAALTALLFLMGPLGAALALGVRRKRPSLFGGEETAAALLTGIVRDRPFLLLLGAALLGAADAFFKKRK